jgi:hypothetical protein
MADIAAKTAGGAVSSVVTSLLTMAAVVTRDPTLVAWAIPVGPFAGAVTEHGADLVRAAWRDPVERVQQFADAVEDETGQPAEDFISEHVDDSAKRELLGRAVEAATAARDEKQVAVLARAFVQGATDGSLVDENLMYIRLLRDLLPGHTRFLAAVYGVAPNELQHVELSKVLSTDPGLTAAAPLLMRQLQQMDLTGYVPNPMRVYLTDLGVSCATWLANHSGSNEPH